MSTAQDHESAARHHDRMRDESWERSGLDGAATQMAHGIQSGRERLAAEIAAAGGTAVFEAAFGLDGVILPARCVETRFGWAWLIKHGRDRAEWLNESTARDWVKRNAVQAERGFYVGRVRAAATAQLGGGGRGMGGMASVTAYAKPDRPDYWADCVVLDNGTVATRLDEIRAAYVRLISRHEERDVAAVDAVVEREFLRRMALAEQEETGG